MTVLAYLPFAVSLLALTFALAAARNVHATSRLMDVTRAQNQRAEANWALTAAYRAKADPGPAKADVAAAEEAVRRAESRLPRRSKSTRAYFAGKTEAS
ncbi:MAG: hypothetical protein JWO11_4131 [Nocardioides sp.]|nr:hypothetical protein [Nocardioides sp.]